MARSTQTRSHEHENSCWWNSYVLKQKAWLLFWSLQNADLARTRTTKSLQKPYASWQRPSTSKIFCRTLTFNWIFTLWSCKGAQPGSSSSSLAALVHRHVTQKNHAKHGDALGMTKPNNAYKPSNLLTLCWCQESQPSSFRKLRGTEGHSPEVQGKYVKIMDHGRWHTMDLVQTTSTK